MVRKLAETIDSTPVALTPKTVIAMIIFVIITTWGLSEIRSRDIAGIAAATSAIESLQCDVGELKKDVKGLREESNENRVQYARIETRLNEIALSIIDLKKAMK